MKEICRLSVCFTLKLVKMTKTLLSQLKHLVLNDTSIWALTGKGPSSTVYSVELFRKQTTHYYLVGCLSELCQPVAHSGRLIDSALEIYAKCLGFFSHVWKFLLSLKNVIFYVYKNNFNSIYFNYIIPFKFLKK